MNADTSDLIHLTIDSVTKYYRQNRSPVLMNVSLQIQYGAVFGLLGESGSGKTTLLRLVAGFEPLTSGIISLAGVKVNDGSQKTIVPEKRGIGVVFQETALLPHLTVYENLSFGLHKLNDEQRKERADYVSRLMHLGEIDKRYPHEISGGQAQRVAIGRALAPQPSLLLLDEPFSSLDPALSSELLDELRSILQETRTTTLIVTHDRNEIFAIADETALLRKGRIQQVGSGETLYLSPINAYVARYFGKVNLIPAEQHFDEWTSALGDVSSFSRIEMAGKNRVSIRPWQLKIAMENNHHTDNGVLGVVESQRFMGEFRELQIRIEGIVNVKVLTIYVEVSLVISMGQVVFVTIDQSKI